MRLATVISLLLFACAACASQPHQEEGRDVFQSSVIPRRAFQRRRLASRRIGGSSSSRDIVPRGNQMYHCTFSEILKELKNVKEKGLNAEDILQSDENHLRPKVYKIKLPHHFGETGLVVKEIRPGLRPWNEEAVKEEARGLAGLHKLKGVLFDGTTYFILMNDMGGKWVQGFPRGSPAFSLIKEANERVQHKSGMKRVYPIGYPPNSLSDYAWTRLRNGLWDVEPVGEWRFGEYTGSNPTKHFRDVEDIHYCGIERWEDHLPVFLRLDGTAAAHHAG